MSGEKNSPESCRKFDSSENEKSTKKKKRSEGSDQISLDVTPRFKSITRSKYRIRDFRNLRSKQKLKIGRELVRLARPLHWVYYQNITKLFLPITEPCHFKNQGKIYLKAI